ncbi:hypothetical protein V8B97DRAFT_1435871 [Scleroderma yunnanense]
MHPNGEKVIVVMGPTGVGKSSFIQDSVPSSLRIKIKVGDSLKSETNEVQSVSWITEDGTAVKLVDTPGFDDSRAGMTDARVLKMIATFLTNEHGKKSPLAGLIYVHRISDTRMGGSLQRNLRIFQKICGPISLKNVVIVTTMWDMVIPEEGLRHEQELRSGQTMFKPLLDEGATMMPHKRTPKSAADVINHLLGKDATMTQIVRELMQEGKALESTAAGSELINDLQARLQKINNERETSKVEIGEIAQTEIVEEMRTMEQTMAGLLQELAELKRGIRVPMESDPPPYESTNFPIPETKCIGHCVKFLRLVKASKSTIPPAHPKISSLAASRANQLADAVEGSVKNVQRGLSILRLTLNSGNMHALQQFVKGDPPPHSFTQGIWTKAQTDMEITSNDIGDVLSMYPKPGIINRFFGGAAVRQFETSNEILESIRVITTDMRTMADWWRPVIHALGNVEDATHRMSGGTGFDDSTVKITLRRVICALESYCEAYATCQDDILKAAEGMPVQYFRIQE